MSKVLDELHIVRCQNGGFVVSNVVPEGHYTTMLAGVSNVPDLLTWLAEQLQPEAPAPAGRPVFVPNETSRPVLAAVERFKDRPSPEGGSL